MAAAAQQQFRVAAVHVVGNSRYHREDVVALSGLQIGRSIAPEELGTSANALASTGLFDSVKYTYTTQNGQIEVTFQIEEAARRIPAIFDNFVWFSDDEIAAALKRDVPGFDGSVPVNEGADAFVARALQRLLAGRQLAGQVRVIPRVDQRSGRTAYVFAVANPAPKVCAISIAGASVPVRQQLLTELAGVPGSDFSRDFLASVEKGTLTDVYRRLGKWDATFSTPTLATDRCAGISVQLNVNEGDTYMWGGASWTGAAGLSADALNKAFDFKPVEIADMSKLESGLRAIHTQYSAIGYIAERARYEPHLDSAAHRADFAIIIEEGPQFHMGTITFPGLAEKDASMLAKKFRLKPGDVYDESYVSKYTRDELGPLRTAAGGRLGLQLKPDEARSVMDLAIVVK
jgi:outer membrane protein assembly factor BamA